MSDLDIDRLADEIDTNPKVFALRFAELITDVKDVQAQIKKGTWLAFTVLVGVIVDLALRLSDQGMGPSQAAGAVLHILT